MFQEPPYPCPKTHCATKSPRLYLWYDMAWPSRAGPQGRPHYCLRRPAPPVARTPPAAGPASPFRTRPSRSGPPARLSLGPASGPSSPPAAPVPLPGPGGFFASRLALSHSGMGPPVPRRAPPLWDCGFAHAAVEALHRA